MKKNLLQLAAAFMVPAVLSVGIILATCSCSMVNETASPEATRVEFGTRTVLGFVIFDWVGIGLFLPSRTIVQLSEDSK